MVWKADFAIYKNKICLLPLVLRSTREAAEPWLNPERQNQKYLWVRCYEQTRTAAGHFVAERPLIYLSLKVT